jgi:hypothetical protein
MRTSSVRLVLFSALLAMPAEAQQRAVEPAAGAAQKWRVTLAPRFGVFVPDKGMGSAEVDASSLTMTSSPTAGLEVELRTPVPWFSLRALAETSVGSQLAERSHVDDRSCVVDCSEPATTSLAVGESSVLTVATDAMFRPWYEAAGAFQPFAFLGGGIKRYDLTHGNRYLVGGQESAFTLHFGGGIEIPVGPVHLSFEAADYMSLLSAAVRSATRPIFIAPPQAQRDRGTLKHDFFLTVGVRLFPD